MESEADGEMSVKTEEEKKSPAPSKRPPVSNFCENYIFTKILGFDHS